LAVTFIHKKRTCNTSEGSDEYGIADFLIDLNLNLDLDPYTDILPEFQSLSKIWKAIREDILHKEEQPMGSLALDLMGFFDS